MLPVPLQAEAPPCARASCWSCWPGGGWIAGCSRQGSSTPSGKRRSTRCWPACSFPPGGFSRNWGMGRAAEVVDLGVNGVRVTVMPTAPNRAERLPDPTGQGVLSIHGGRLEKLGSQRPWSLASSRGTSAMPRSPRTSAVGSCCHMKTEAMRGCAWNTALDREDGNSRLSATPTRRAGGGLPRHSTGPGRKTRPGASGWCGPAGAMAHGYPSLYNEYKMCHRECLPRP